MNAEPIFWSFRKRKGAGGESLNGVRQRIKPCMSARHRSLHDPVNAVVLVSDRFGRKSNAKTHGFFGIRLRVCCIASCASMSRPAATSASPRLSDSRLCCKSVSDRRDACHRWKRSSMAIPASSIRECSRTNFRKASTSSSTVLMDRILQFVPAQIKLNYIVPRHPANPREVVGIGGGFTQSHRALGRSLPACRNRWARLFVKQAASGQPRRGNRTRPRNRASHLQRATPRQSGANRSSRPTGTSATGPARAHDTAAAGHNFTADTATIRSMARAYDGLAAHHPGRQRPQRGNPAPPDPRHPPLGHSVDPPADRLPDPHETAAPAHPRSSRQPGFKLQFELRHRPQHRPPRCRFA